MPAGTATGPKPGSQMPSSSKPNRSEPGTESGSCEIGEDELFLHADQRVLGALVRSLVGVLRDDLACRCRDVIRNWQPVFW